MNRRPLVYTSPFNGMSMAMYLCVAVLGGVHLFDLSNITSVVDWAGEEGADWWARAMLVGGSLAFLAPFGARPSTINVAAAVEAVACWFVSAVNVIYVAALIIQYGLASNLPTKTMATALALGGAARMGQIIRELLRDRRARRNPVPADPVPLAEPPRE